MRERSVAPSDRTTFIEKRASANLCCEKYFSHLDEQQIALSRSRIVCEIMIDLVSPLSHIREIFVINLCCIFD